MLDESKAIKTLEPFRDSMLFGDKDDIITMGDIVDYLKMQPVDAAPVVHGQWLGKRYDFKKYEYVTVPYDATTFDNPDNLFCSICQKPALQNGCEDDVPSDYCPHCGAKMDGTYKEVSISNSAAYKN